MEIQNVKVSKSAILPTLFGWYAIGEIRLYIDYLFYFLPDAPIQTASISGDKVLSIPSCPDKKKLSIIHAMYGKGGRCQMYCVVFALCHGKVSCIIPNMAQFRKSCPGSTTELKVRYQCV